MHVDPGLLDGSTAHHRSEIYTEPSLHRLESHDTRVQQERRSSGAEIAHILLEGYAQKFHPALEDEHGGGQTAGPRKDRSRVHDEMEESIGYREHSQEWTIASSEPRAQLNRKWTPRNAGTNSHHDTPCLHDRLLSGSTQHLMSSHVPVR